MKLYNQIEVSNLLDVPLHRLETWANNGKLVPSKIDLSKNGEKSYIKENLLKFDIAQEVFDSKWQEFTQITPNRHYNSIELFAGAGGLALGMEKAGIQHALLNEIDKYACATLKHNRPEWNVLEGDVRFLMQVKGWALKIREVHYFLILLVVSMKYAQKFLSVRM